MSLDLLSIVHVNVNCSDLDSSLAFYRDVIGLQPMSHTKPAPQQGEGFGLSGEVQWDAHLLHDHRAQAGPALDLLQWMQPKPTGAAPEAPSQVGLNRLCVAVPDAQAMHDALHAAGATIFSPPVDMALNETSSAQLFFARDPDGTMIEFVSGAMPVPAPQLLHANINCRNLAASSEWYQRVLGLEVVMQSAPGPVDGAVLGFDHPIEWDAQLLAIPGQAARFMIDLLEWKRPAPVGQAAPSANTLGPYRMAFLVADARIAVQQLRELGVDCPDAVWLDMGPDIAIDGLWAAFFADPDGTCLELIGVPQS